jgi:hypothetical protein
MCFDAALPGFVFYAAVACVCFSVQVVMDLTNSLLIPMQAHIRGDEIKRDLRDALGMSHVGLIWVPRFFFEIL